MNIIQIILVFLEGFLAFISPCILPMLPIYFIYLSGQAATETTNPLPEQTPPKRPKKILLRNTIFFVLGFTLVFVILGATSTAIGKALNQHKDILGKLSGIILIILGIHMTGLIQWKWLNKEVKLPFRGQAGKRFSAFLLGIVFSIGWSPCLSPFLGAAMLTARGSDTIFQGIFLLFMFALGLGIPFILTSLLFEELHQAFAFIKKHMMKIRLVSGCLMILLGILMLTNWFNYYTSLFY